MALFVGGIVIAAIIALLGELNVITDCFKKFENANFYTAVCLELITIVVIPFALKLFNFKKIKNLLVTQQDRALIKWGTFRILLLIVPMIANTLCYYLFDNVAYGYLAIILLLCLCFVYPSMSRCEDECSEPEQTELPEQ